MTFGKHSTNNSKKSKKPKHFLAAIKALKNQITTNEENILLYEIALKKEHFNDSYLKKKIHQIKQDNKELALAIEHLGGINPLIKQQTLW